MKRVIALLLAVLMSAALLAGCGAGREEGIGTPSAAPSAPASASPSDETPDASVEPSGEATGDEVELPLTEDPVTFTYFLYNSTTFEDFNGYADNLFYQWMEEKTGVHIEFVHPAVGNQNEAFQMMILSNEYTDFVQSIKTYYNGGVDKAIEDGVLVRLNDAVDKWMPHYRKYVYESDEVYAQCISDSGALWGVHHIVDYPQGAGLGQVLRQDWLDDLGLDISLTETMGGLEEILTAFKTKTLDGEGPLWLGTNSTQFAYSLNGSFNYSGVGRPKTDFINKDGTATYGAFVGLKEYAAQMADWYKKGLINRNFIAEAAMVPPDDKWINGNVGCGETFYTYIDMYSELAKESVFQPDDDFRLAPFTTPKLNAEDSYSEDIHLRQTNAKVRVDNSMGITTHCNDLELACRYWDYAWTDEGIEKANWGTLGEYGDENSTYYIDPTDANGDGHVECYQPWALAKYHNVSNVQTKFLPKNGPVYSIWSREWCTLSQEAIECQNVWNMAGADWVWPEGVTLTVDEGAESSGILVDCDSAVTEWLAQVIVGSKSADTYDTELMPTLEDFNIHRAEELYQQALERYYARAELKK